MKLQPSFLLAILAAACGMAHGQSTVHLSGELDLAAASIKPPGKSSARSLETGVGGASHLLMHGTEDLGVSGLTAQFKLDSNIAADTGSTVPTAFWSREATVGLKSADWGVVTLGRNVNPMFDLVRSANAFGESRFAPMVNVVAYTTSHALKPAQDNSVRWSSPTTGAFSGALLYRFTEQSGYRYASGNVMYHREGGNFTFRLGADHARAVAQKGHLTSVVWGPEFDLGTVRLMGSFAIQRDTELNKKLRGFEIGMRAPVGQGEIKAAASTAQKSTLDDQDPSRITVVGLGYDYNLSKRTALFAIGNAQRISHLGAGYAAGVGVHHRF
jgi:predicted porin